MSFDLGVAYALVAAVGWGAFIFANKRYFAAYPSASFMGLTYGFGALWYLPVALAVAPPPALAPVEWAFAGWTVACLAAGLGLFFAAVRRGDVSYVAPVGKVTPVFVLPIEVVLLGDRFRSLQVAGIGLATVAVYLANYRGGPLLAPVRKATTERAPQLALASAGVLAVLNVSQGVLLQDVGLDPRTWLLVKAGGAALLFAPLAVRDHRAGRLPDVRADVPRLAAAGLLLAVSEYFVVASLAILSASIATPLLATQAVVAVILGGVVLREGQFAIRLAAAAVAVAGVTLIALPG